MKRLHLPLHVVIFALVLAATCLVYRAGLNGGFQFDDAGNIEYNSAVHIATLSPEALQRAAFSGGAGPLKRPLSMLSFALNHYFTGPGPYGYKAVNLGIHLSVGIALYWLALVLLRAHARSQSITLSPEIARWLAFGTASVWLLHPLAMTSVLYVVQRMTSLSTLFMALGLACYVLARERMRARQGSIAPAVAALAVFTPLAAAFKETGLLLPLYALVCEATLLDSGGEDAAQRRAVRFLFGLTVALPLIAFVAYVLAEPGYLLNGYRLRDYDLVRRLLTEARVLWSYVHMILLPDVRQMALYHDDLAISADFATPTATAPAVVALIAALVTAWFARRRLPWVAFGIGFFLAGHVMESTVFALDLMHEHRNYLPMFGLLLAVIASLGTPRFMPDTFKLRAALIAVLILLLGSTTALRASYWSNPVTMAEMEVSHHPKSARANYEAARQYDYLLRNDKNPISAEIDYRTAMQYLYQASQAQPDFTPGVIGRILIDADHGTRPDETWLESARAILARAPYAPDLVDLLRAFSDCQRSGKCRFSDAEAVSLFQAALANPRLHAGSLAAVLTSASDYVATRPRNLDNAIALASAATQAAPGDPRYHLNLAVILMAAGKLDAARSEIAATKGLDRFNVLAEEIRGYESRLAGMAKGG